MTTDITAHIKEYYAILLTQEATKIGLFCGAMDDFDSTRLSECDTLRGYQMTARFVIERNTYQVKAIPHLFDNVDSISPFLDEEI